MHRHPACIVESALRNRQLGEAGGDWRGELGIRSGLRPFGRIAKRRPRQLEIPHPHRERAGVGGVIECGDTLRLVLSGSREEIPRL
jgi:hypothetical protein